MMSIRKIQQFFMVIFFIGLNACIDEIPLDVPEGNTRKVVIQGNIINSIPAQIEINVSESADFLNYFNAEQISNAKVSIIDEADRSINIPERQPGIYQTEWFNNASFEIVNGKSYRLQVEVPDGQTYISDYEPLHAVPKVDAIHIGLETRSVLNESENIVETQFIQFLVDTPLKHPDETDKAYLKWNMHGVFRMRELLPPIPASGPTSCYIFDEIGLDNISIFNGFETGSFALDKQLIYEEPVNWNYSDAYYLTVFQQSLSKGAYEYWQRVKEVTDRQGSLFDSPPGRIKSNIQNVNNSEEQILGYFYCTEIDTIRRLITPSDAGTPSDRCSAFNYSDPDTPDYCKDCTLWPRSSTVKPSYWVE